MELNPPKILPIEIIIDSKIKKIFKNAHVKWSQTKRGIRIKVRSEY